MINYKLVIGLVCVMLANIIFGSSIAKIKKEFKSKTFWNGCYKVLTMIVGTILMYIMAYYNPDMLLVSINGINLDMKSAIETIITSGIAIYGAMDLKKIAQLIGVSTSIDNVIEDPTVNVPEDNYIKR